MRQHCRSGVHILAKSITSLLGSCSPTASACSSAGPGDDGLLPRISKGCWSLCTARHGTNIQKHLRVLFVAVLRFVLRACRFVLMSPFCDEHFEWEILFIHSFATFQLVDRTLNASKYFFIAGIAPDSLGDSSPLPQPLAPPTYSRLRARHLTATFGRRPPHPRAVRLARGTQRTQT